MKNENRNYRIRTEVGNDSPNVVNVKLNQTFEFLNILSLSIGQKNIYKIPSAGYGVVVGRVLLGGKSFGIQNAKVSIFIPKDSISFDVKDDILYTYSSVDSPNKEGVRYNLLPSFVDEACHQNVGTMFEKEYVLDNNDVIRIFDTYYTYTTTTNSSGDYFIYGVPVGQHTLHVDVDLSDIGKLSVRPHDMIAQGYDINQFESPNKFKADKNLNVLPQIKAQNKPIYIYPFWGDTSNDETNALITRADIEIDYKFEPSAVFMGSIITDKGTNSVSHKCVPDDKTGKMSELATGEGRIEMIRKTFDGKVEQFSVKGNRLIDGDGVWCYQIPMNLDYVVMDEFGNIVPTDNPDRGLPTRARVRFRISLDESPTDDSATKRARFLVPNNPRLTDDYPDYMATHSADYEFGTFTKEESYRDMFWNNVYTVKSYIPRLQKKVKPKPNKHTGIKMTNHAGDNNPFPFNNLKIKMNFTYRFLCMLLRQFLILIWLLNLALAPIGIALLFLGKALCSLGFSKNITKESGPLSKLIKNAAGKAISAGVKCTIKLDSEFCDDGGMSKMYVLGPGMVIEEWRKLVKENCRTNCSEGGSECDIELTGDMDSLMNCVENELAQSNEATSFDFQNDWINGVLYAPLWYRKIKPKKRLFFGLIKTRGKDQWCDGSSSKMAQRGKGLKLYQPCAQKRYFERSDTRIKAIKLGAPPKKRFLNKIKGFPDVFFFGYKEGKTEDNCYGYKCHNKTVSYIRVDNGIIIRKETKYGEYVYYYKSVEYDTSKLNRIIDNRASGKGELKLLFATDIVLLGSLNECDTNGIPQFFKHLSETTYNMPPDLVSLSWNINEELLSDNDNADDIDEGVRAISDVHTEYTGSDWGNAGYDQWYEADSNETSYLKDGSNERDNGGLFYDIDCNFSYVKPKSCVNLSRICEFGVSLDQSIVFEDSSGIDTFMPPDGFVSYDELYNMDARAMFATMNGNRLREKIDPKTGFPTYDFDYLYPENFDGIMRDLMSEIPATQRTSGGIHAILYSGNRNLERNSDAYLRFRYGYDPNIFKVSFYDSNIKMGNYKDDAKINKGRFPRYENSFYFYFGLHSGKTAIDKLRNNFYAECTNDDAAKYPIVINYVPNTWCNDDRANETLMDGWISFDLSRIVLPCSITMDERNNGNLDDRTYTGINSYKLYIGAQNSALESDGYVRLYTDADGKQMPSGTTPAPPYYPKYVKNGYYVITIIDSNGERNEYKLDFEGDKLSYDVIPTSFGLTNSELMLRFPTYQQAASDTVYVTGSSLLREIGGYIDISAITNNGEPMTDNFEIRIENNTIPGYTGSGYNVCNGVVTQSGVNMLPSSPAGEYAFGVPKGGEYYLVTVTELCPLRGCIMSGNSVQKKVYVSEPLPMKMYVNGVDTDLLKNFNTGYIKNSCGIIYSPSDTDLTSPTCTLNGWLNFNDIGVTGLIPYPSGTPYTYSMISNEVTALSHGVSYVYDFDSDEDYIFDPANDIVMDLDKFDTVPNVSDLPDPPNPPYYIEVGPNRDVYYYDNVPEQYIMLGHPLTFQEYFDNYGIDTQYDIISTINVVIQKRLDLVQSMIDAFWMYDNSEENKFSTVTFSTNETPVKTMIYYLQDSRLGSIASGGSCPTEYTILDTNYEENTITEFSNPTIKNNYIVPRSIDPSSPYIYGGFGYPEFFHNTYAGIDFYKFPPYCGIKNRVDVTVPSTLGAPPFTRTVIGDSMAITVGGNGMYDMFGFHIIDKRPFTDDNVWIPLNEYPIYWPDLTDTTTPTTVPGFVEGGYMNVNGCISGYFYNAFSSSRNQYAKFTAQRATDDIGIYTLTLDGNNNPDEFAVPTKRMLYREEPDSNHTPTYNDYFETTPAYSGFDSDSDHSIGSGNSTDNRYIQYNSNTYSLTVTDERATFTEDLLANSMFGLPEDTVLTTNTLPKPVFYGHEDEDVVYSVYNSNNPIYQRTYDNSPLLPNGINYPKWDMQFRSNLTASDTFDPNNPEKTMFYIGMMGEKFVSGGERRYRGISPTYERLPVNVYYYADNSTDWHPYVDIFFTTANVSGGVITPIVNPKDYYLRNYKYQIVMVYETDGGTQEIVSEPIDSGFTDPSITHATNGGANDDYNNGTFCYWKPVRYVFDEVRFPYYIGWNIDLFVKKIYIKDVTKVRRDTERWLTPLP